MLANIKKCLPLIFQIQLNIKNLHKFMTKTKNVKASSYYFFYMNQIEQVFSHYLYQLRLAEI